MCGNLRIILVCLMLMILAIGCKTGPINVFKPASPHEAYLRKLTSSGLDETELGRKWIALSDSILLSAVGIELPYREQGYFPAEEVGAAAYAFSLTRGQKLRVEIDQTPGGPALLFLDLWHWEEGGKADLIASADSSSLEMDVRTTGRYILRLQPQLLASAGYVLELNTGPSLAYPLKTYRQGQIQSFWGAGRDNNSRKHEGIDIFSAFRTPVLAVEDGTARVMENDLGGRVVFLRSRKNDHSIYYAHLDEQYVRDGQAVKLGDTIGFMGNTGNARTTPPHLHLGIYTSRGAVDPLPYVVPRISDLPEIRSERGKLNTVMRTSGSLEIGEGSQKWTIPSGTPLTVQGAAGSSYRVSLPDGKHALIPAARLSDMNSPLRRMSLKGAQAIGYDRPDTNAAVKLRLGPEATVNVLATFGDFQLIENDRKERAWVR